MEHLINMRTTFGASAVFIDLIIGDWDTAAIGGWQVREGGVGG